MQITAKVFDRTEQVYAVTVSGNILREDIPSITKCLNSVLEEKAQHIILIFSGTEWMTAYFVRVLLSFLYYIRLSGGKFIIVNDHDELNRIFRAYGFDKVVDILHHEMDAFEKVYDKKKKSTIDTGFKQIILSKIENQIGKEDQLIESGELVIPDSAYDLNTPSEDEEAEKTTKYRDPGDIDLIEQDIDDFDATVEMNLVEMGLIDAPSVENAPSEATIKVSKEEFSSDSSEIEVMENPVQFLDVKKLDIEHDTDFDKEIQKQSEVFRKEAQNKGITTRKPTFKNFSHVSLKQRSDVVLSGEELFSGGRVLDNSQTPFLDLLNNLPDSKSASSLRSLVDVTVQASEEKHDIILFIDSDTLRNGLSGWIIKLLRTGAVSGIITTLTAALRDFEITHGVPVKREKEEVFKGEFGISRDLYAEFEEVCGGSGIPVSQFMMELFQKKSGSASDSSIFHNAFRQGIFVTFAPIEVNAALIQVERNRMMVDAINHGIGAATGSKEPVILFPGNGIYMYSLFSEILKVLVNSGMRPEDLTAGVFASEEKRDFTEVAAAMGLSVLQIGKDPGLYFPLFCECYLNASK